MGQKKSIRVFTVVAALVVASTVVLGIVRIVGEEREPTGPPGRAQRGDGQPELSGQLENGVRVIEMTAQQFRFEPEQIVVRQGETVRLEVVSRDTRHGIGIKEFGIDRVLEPDKKEVVEFKADKAGTFTYRCTVYCGRGHSQMKGKMTVLAAT